MCRSSPGRRSCDSPLRGCTYIHTYSSLAAFFKKSLTDHFDRGYRKGETKSWGTVFRYPIDTPRNLFLTYFCSFVPRSPSPSIYPISPGPFRLIDPALCCNLSRARSGIWSTEFGRSGKIPKRSEQTLVDIDRRKKRGRGFHYCSASSGGQMSMNKVLVF